MLYAIGNSGEPGLAAEAERRLDDPSPLVRGAAVWALSRLLSDAEFEGLRSARFGAELDASVLEEWRLSTPVIPAKAG